MEAWKKGVIGNANNGCSFSYVVDINVEIPPPAPIPPASFWSLVDDFASEAGKTISPEELEI